MKNNFTILAIDTSCDETSVAVTVNERIMANVVSSQVELHKKWGGVVPVIAQRAHRDKIDLVIFEALKRFSQISNFEFLISKQIPSSKLNKEIIKQTTYETIKKQIDAIAVTVGPGLAPALEVGISKAKELATKLHKPIIPINHMEGHLLCSFAQNSKGKSRNFQFLIANFQFPLLGFLISGGHTELVLVNGVDNYKVVGRTLDDACGEAYDKVAKLLDLGYPGGPIIERLAKEGNEQVIQFPIPMKGRKDADFSFSGLKTAVKYYIDKEKRKKPLDRHSISHIAVSFQYAVAESLLDRLEFALNKYKPHGVLTGGGVFSNIYIRSAVRKMVRQHALPLFTPYFKTLYTDNAGMIGICAFLRYKKGLKDVVFELDRKPNLSL
jgi:N6-L-threonylcarbamoyladenine synthase